MTVGPALLMPLAAIWTLFLLSIPPAAVGAVEPKVPAFSAGSRIPKMISIFHGFDAPDSSLNEEMKFSLVEYASVLSGLLLEGATVRIYVPDTAPRGVFWDMAAPHVSKVISVPTWNANWDGPKRARKLLVLKLSVLQREGGIVMDSDILVTKHRMEFQNSSFLIAEGEIYDGKQTGDHINSCGRLEDVDPERFDPASLMMAEPSSSFAQSWLGLLKERPDISPTESLRILLRTRRTDCTVVGGSQLVWPERRHNGLATLYFGRKWKAEQRFALKLWRIEAMRRWYPPLTLDFVKASRNSLSCFIRTLLVLERNETISGLVDCRSQTNVDATTNQDFLGKNAACFPVRSLNRAKCN